MTRKRSNLSKIPKPGDVLKYPDGDLYLFIKAEQKEALEVELLWIQDGLKCVVCYNSYEDFAKYYTIPAQTICDEL
jgi:signal peptidase I